MIASNVFA